MSFDHVMIKSMWWGYFLDVLMVCNLQFSTQFHKTLGWSSCLFGRYGICLDDMVFVCFKSEPILAILLGRGNEQLDLFFLHSIINVLKLEDYGLYKPGLWYLFDHLNQEVIA